MMRITDAPHVGILERKFIIESMTYVAHSSLIQALLGGGSISIHTIMQNMMGAISGIMDVS